MVCISFNSHHKTARKLAHAHARQAVRALCEQMLIDCDDDDDDRDAVRIVLNLYTITDE